MSHLNVRLKATLVTITGLRRPCVADYMNACNVLLLTSKHEGSPTVVREALACNLPVVSVDAGDVREHIRRVEGCVLCEDDRPETIAQALEQVLRRNRRVEGRAAILDFEEGRLTQQVLSVYRSAVSRRGDAHGNFG